MAFKIERNKPDTPAATVVVKERIYLDSAGKATTDQKKAVSLFAPPGATISEADAAAVGLLAAPKKSTGKAAPKNDG